MVMADYGAGKIDVNSKNVWRRLIGRQTFLEISLAHPERRNMDEVGADPAGDRAEDGDPRKDRMDPVGHFADHAQ